MNRKEGVSLDRRQIFFSAPIPASREWDAGLLSEIAIEDSGEPLVPVSLLPERILVRSQYFLQGLPGSMPECFLRRRVFDKLAEASDLLPKGYRFVVFDGWRAPSLQKHLFRILEGEIASAVPDMDEEELSARTSQYVARPSVSPANPSPHLTGGAVDLGIADAMGAMLDMGSSFDETSAISETSYYEKLLAGRELSPLEERALRNRRFLFHVMTSVGFTNYPDEWWHYDFGNQNWVWATSSGGNAKYGIAYPDMRWKREFD